MEWDTLIVRYAEIAVKGKHTRSLMIRLLKNNIGKALEREGIEYLFHESPGRLFVKIDEQKDMERASRIIKRVFGVKSLSPSRVYSLRGGIEDVLKRVTDDFIERIKGSSFRIRSRRVGQHDFTSKDVERIAGSLVLQRDPRLQVDLEHPEYTLWIEIRGGTVYAYDTVLEGPGGLPLGSSGRSLVLYSGGFDSTVASWYIMRRGSRVDLVYYDIGDEENFKIARQAAESLYENYVMGAYNLVLYRVWFHTVAERLSSLVNPAYSTLVLRRLMLEHASRLALTLGYHALTTGESLAQVSSQTPESLYVVGANLPVPVYRPLIGMDKDDVMEKAREIGVYEIVSRQREFCAQRKRRPTPNPRPALFEKEVLSARAELSGLLPRLPLKKYVFK